MGMRSVISGYRGNEPQSRQGAKGHIEYLEQPQDSNHVLCVLAPLRLKSAAPFLKYFQHVTGRAGKKIQRKKCAHDSYHNEKKSADNHSLWILVYL